MTKILKKCLNFLENKEPIVMVTILNSEGSTPRIKGTKMLIRRDDTILGTIGGGGIEAEAITLAKTQFSRTNALIIPFDLNAQSIKNGLVCGGQLTVLIETIQPNSDNIDLYHSFITASNTGVECVCVTELAIEGYETMHVKNIAGSVKICSLNRYIVLKDGTPISGTNTFTKPQGVSIEKVITSHHTDYLSESQSQHFFFEPSIKPDTVYLFGAGHVSREVAKIAHLVDFRVVVFDDRQEYANKERFEKANEINVIPSFDHGFDTITFDKNSYAVIVTRGHAHDKTVLAQMLQTSAGYIGMIGSRKKRDTLYRLLQEEGFSSEDISRVYCPIGVEILADSPEEIAVSIVAELISVRAKKNKRS